MVWNLVDVHINRYKYLYYRITLVSIDKMAAIFQCRSVNIKENAIKNELIDLKLSLKRGMVFFFLFFDKRGIFQLIF